VAVRISGWFSQKLIRLLFPEIGWDIVPGNYIKLILRHKARPAPKCHSVLISKMSSALGALLVNTSHYKSDLVGSRKNGLLRHRLGIGIKWYQKGPEFDLFSGPSRSIGIGGRFSTVLNWRRGKA
jgi:hypothetical protein